MAKIRQRPSRKSKSPKIVGITKRTRQQTRNRELKPLISNSVCNTKERKIPKKKKNNSVKRITCGREIKYATGKDNLNIEITCDILSSSLKNKCHIFENKSKKQDLLSNTSNEVSSTTTGNRSLNDIYRTIDCVETDNENDVILINDCDDSDVIYVEPRKKPTQIDESVILVEDDSVIEIPMTPVSVNNQNQCLPSPIKTNVNMQIVATRHAEFATSTPVRSVSGFSTGFLNVAQRLVNIEMESRGPITNTINSLPIALQNAPNRETLSDQNNQVVVPTNLNKFGFNFLNAGTVRTQGLRPVFIDGSNVAMGHSNGKFFSVAGLKICIDYFKLRGHEVTAIVPMFRKRRGQNSNSLLLQKLEKEGTVIFTPSRRINGKNIVPYDDRYIVLLAHVHKGVIVSSDNYRDLLEENPVLLETIENRVLNPTWLKDMIIFPSDPLGRHGPKLDEFLRFP